MQRDLLMCALRELPEPLILYEVYEQLNEQLQGRDLAGPDFAALVRSMLFLSGSSSSRCWQLRRGLRTRLLLACYLSPLMTLTLLVRHAPPWSNWHLYIVDFCVACSAFSRKYQCTKRYGAFASTQRPSNSPAF